MPGLFHIPCNLARHASPPHIYKGLYVLPEFRISVSGYVIQRFPHPILQDPQARTPGSGYI